MKCKERIEIIRELRCVDYVFETIDTDRIVSKKLTHTLPYLLYIIYK